VRRYLKIFDPVACTQPIGLHNPVRQILSQRSLLPLNRSFLNQPVLQNTFVKRMLGEAFQLMLLA